MVRGAVDAHWIGVVVAVPGGGYTALRVVGLARRQASTFASASDLRQYRVTEPSMTERATIERLAEGVEMLRDAWLEVASIEHGRNLLAGARPALGRFGDYSAFIRQWHYDSVLSAARRMLDGRKDVRSLVRALRIIAALIEQLDEDGLIELWKSTRDTPLDVESETEARAAFQQAATAPAENGRRISRAGPEADIARLTATHDHVVDLVHNTIAHRRAGLAGGQLVVGDQPIDDGDVDAVLRDIVEVASKWTGLLAGAELDIRNRTPSQRHSFVRALELFDVDAYHDAVFERLKELGPIAPAAAYDAVEREVEAKYVWPE